jgi:hypothetical protein
MSSSSAQANPEGAASTSGIRQRQTATNNTNDVDVDVDNDTLESVDSTSGDDDELRKPTKTYGRTPDGTGTISF